MSSPATVVKEILVEEAVVAEHDATPWPCFVSFLPDTPDECVSVTDTAGGLDGRMMRTGEQIEHPGIQVTIRGKTYIETFEKATAIATLLDQVNKRSVALSSDEAYDVQNISRSGAINPVGIDERNDRRRYHFTVNYTMTLKQTQ